MARQGVSGGLDRRAMTMASRAAASRRVQNATARRPATRRPAESRPVATLVADRAPRLVTESERALLLAAYRESLPIESGVQTDLAAALRDVLQHPGSLARAQLAYGVAADRASRETAIAVAIAIEYFHSASLVFDDLPAMDDADLRRGRPCPHRVWGDGIAILAALALVNRAYELLWSALGSLPKVRRDEAATLVATSLGLDGIVGGQARDLHFAPSGEPDQRAAVEIAMGKTVSLIRLTLVLPAIVAGVPRRTRDRLAALATPWGMSYQILDDFRDELASPVDADKTAHRDEALGRPNHARLAGTRRALLDLEEHLRCARLVVERFDRSTRLSSLVESVQLFLEQEALRVHRALGTGR
jgi:geranylgeranyl pyrophosphate synthase